MCSVHRIRQRPPGSAAAESRGSAVMLTPNLHAAPSAWLRQDRPRSIRGLQVCTKWSRAHMHAPRSHTSRIAPQPVAQPAEKVIADLASPRSRRASSHKQHAVPALRVQHGRLLPHTQPLPQTVPWRQMQLGADAPVRRHALACSARAARYRTLRHAWEGCGIAQIGAPRSAVGCCMIPFLPLPPVAAAPRSAVRGCATVAFLVGADDDRLELQQRHVGVLLHRHSSLGTCAAARGRDSADTCALVVSTW